MLDKPILFLKSAVLPKDYPPPLRAEYVFVGRSNVGKSSLLNAIFHTKIAKVSSTPGKTRLLNFFKRDRALFVDVPGYGYAQVSKEERGAWQGMLDAYFSSRRPIQTVFALIDGRHEPTDLDRQMVYYLIHMEIPFVIVLTKWDALNQSEKTLSMRRIEACFNGTAIFPVSAKTAYGLRDLKACFA